MAGEGVPAFTVILPPIVTEVPHVPVSLLNEPKLLAVISGATLTVSVAAVVVAEPQVLVNTARY